jgi:hypothetical protein
MKKYWLRKAGENVVTNIEADLIFWSGIAVVFVKNNVIIAVIGMSSGDVVIEDGAWKDVPASELPGPQAKKPPDDIVN